MRTIGRKNRNFVRRLTQEEQRRGEVGVHNITERVIDKLPVSLWDTWEGADSEIRNLIWDAVFSFEREVNV